ncbi:MAG: C39 family peptidase [Anaerolineae bacterium]|nr:C39 family peptidase [Anaerolineae bacterium]
MTTRMLNVPFVSRHSEDGARLDCGACCVAMLLEAMTQPTSAHDVAAAGEANPTPGKTGCRLSPTAVLRGALAQGLTMFQGKSQTLSDLTRLIDDGQPPIVALKYGLLADRLERRCTGRHYVLVVGYDNIAGLVYVNDPHYPEACEGRSGGYRRAYAYEAFLAAWEGLGFNLLAPVPAPPPFPRLDAALSFAAPTGGAAKLGDAWVIASPSLWLRPQPNVSADDGAVCIPFGQHVAVLSPESGPDALGYTWQRVLTDQGVTGWMAAASSSGERYLSSASPFEMSMMYVLDTSPVRQAGGLSLREGRDIESALLERISIGGQLAVSHRVTEADGTPWLWVQSTSGISGWAREKADGVMLVSVAPPVVASSGDEGLIAGVNRYGININPSPQDAHRPLTTVELQGVGWVRFVFKQSALHYTEAQSFAHYDTVVDYYRAAGTKSLMILNWESFWGHGPWDHGDWPRYANDFGNYVRGVVQHFKGRVAAYQIWNEGDNREGHGTSIYIAPETYAPILLATGRAIREVDPAAKVVFGGVCGGPEGNVNYVRQTRAAMHGEWPVDAVGMHPYGRYPANIPTEVPHLSRWGGLQDYLNTVTQGLPDPIWITEIGVPNDNLDLADNSAYHWEEIARYLQEVYAEVGQRYRERVPVVLWFAWSNKMRGSGIVDSHDNPKGPIYDTFFKIVRGPV